MAGLALAVGSLVLALVPFAGWVGGLAIGLALKAGRGRVAMISMALGGLAVLSMLGWGLVFLLPVRPIGRGAGPQIHSHDGSRYVLDADLLADAPYPWAERHELARLESLREVDGEYRVRMVHGGAKTAHVDSVGLLVLDHPSSVRPLPGPHGELFFIEAATAPRQVRDARGANVEDTVAQADGVLLSGATTAQRGEPRQQWTFDFSSPTLPAAEPGEAAARQPFLFLRARSSRFAEEAFLQYLATMGQGMGPLMEHVMRRPDCRCSQEVMEEELTLLGMPLVVAQPSPQGWKQLTAIAPLGPAVMRSFVIPLPPSEAGTPVSVQLSATPGFWEIDEVKLATGSRAVAPPPLPPHFAQLETDSVKKTGRREPQDLIRTLADTDQQRIVLDAGQALALRFPAPPSRSGLRRSLLIAMRGYYLRPIGGRWLVNPAAVLAHRLGLTSLPRFAARLSTRP